MEIALSKDLPPPPPHTVSFQRATWLSVLTLVWVDEISKGPFWPTTQPYAMQSHHWKLQKMAISYPISSIIRSSYQGHPQIFQEVSTLPSK